jgi:hypothetical protein
VLPDGASGVHQGDHRDDERDDGDDELPVRGELTARRQPVEVPQPPGEGHRGDEEQEHPHARPDHPAAPDARTSNQNSTASPP